MTKTYHQEDDRFYFKDMKYSYFTFNTLWSCDVGYYYIDKLTVLLIRSVCALEVMAL